MREHKYAARMKGPDELHSEAEARMVAETMGGEVAFGAKPILLYAADLEFLARVKSQQDERKSKRKA